MDVEGEMNQGPDRRVFGYKDLGTDNLSDLQWYLVLGLNCSLLYSLFPTKSLR